MTTESTKGKAPTPASSSGVIFDAPLSFGTVPPSLLSIPVSPSYLISWDSMTYCMSPAGNVLDVLKKMLAVPEVWGTSHFWVEYTCWGFDYIPFSYPCPKGWDSIETYTPQ